MTAQQSGEMSSGSASVAQDWSALMRRAQDGDKAAYATLLAAIALYLRRMAARNGLAPHDAEDAVQDILLTVHAIRHTYDPARPFGPWLTAIAQRRIIDRLRQRSRIMARETGLASTHETLPAPEANLYEMRWEVGRLHQAIAALPDGQRRAVKLLKLREMSLAEASAQSGLSVSALKVATHRAVKALRRCFGRETG